MLNAWNKYNNIYEALKPEIPFKLTKPIVFHLNQNMFLNKKIIIIALCIMTIYFIPIKNKMTHVPFIKGSIYL
jgi:hypothetical protein